ncbi:MAG: hypothetical protein LBF62_02020 [Tannerellaceae bacterium]|nr:hypothetical protein [Tannerellaceae bacterium]
MWQDPAPRRAYRDNLVHYNWHWFWHWGTGEALNNGTHEIDVIRWGLGVDFPTNVSSEGADRGVIFYGEAGAMHTGHNGFRVYDPDNKLIRETDSKEVIDGRDTSSPSANLDTPHIQNFLDAIRDNKLPGADIAELHKSTTWVQLGNIAWRTGRRPFQRAYPQQPGRPGPVETNLRTGLGAYSLIHYNRTLQ